MSRAQLLTGLWVLGLGVGCSTESPAVVAPAAPRPVANAATGAEEMCAEHGVLEALCTKCHPKLIPVFQAKGDWCPEHGFPESICPTCHPEAGGRPAKAISPADEAPPDGVRVTLATPEAAGLAGIVTAPAASRDRAEIVDATVEIAFDATRVAEVRPPRAGIVAAVQVDLGTNVASGAPLVRLTIPEISEQRARLAGARIQTSAAAAEHRRQSKLLKDQLVTREGVAAARGAWLAAKAEADALEASLTASGASTGELTVTAPIAGEIQTRNVLIGSAVTPESRLFTIVDTSTVWAVLAVAEADLARISLGQAVEVSLDGLVDRVFTGKVAWVNPSVDPHTRTGTVRVPLANPDGVLREHMYGTARVTVSSSTSRVFVPRRAVQRAKSVSLIFVPEGQTVFVGHRVKLGMTDDDDVEVVKGLDAGTLVVTNGSFFLKTETLKGSIGAGCCAAEE